METRAFAFIAAVGWLSHPLPALSQTSAAPAVASGVTVPVKLDQAVSSSAAKVGDRFTFTTTQTVKLGDVTVPAGSQGHGIVAAARAAKWDKGGDLALQVVSLDLADGGTVSVIAAREPRPEGHSMIGETVKAAEKGLKPEEAIPTALVPLALPVRGILLLGTALHILKGHNVTFPAGTPFSVTPAVAQE